MRTGKALLSAVLLGIPLAGCDDRIPARIPDGTLRMGLATAPRNLDPRFATDAASERINRLLYRRLVAFDAASRPIPALATWEQPTPARYLFTLGQDGRIFSDGSRLDAEDVKATYASILDPAGASPHRALLSIIQDIRTHGPDRIEFRLAEPDPLFPAYLGIGILPAALIRRDHGFQRAPVGSGPFRFLDWPETGRLRLERRRDRRRLELLLVKDPNVRVMKLLRGEIHLLQNDLAPELLDYLRGRPEVRVRELDGANFSYLGFNLRDPVTGLLPVRRAIAHAIDRRAILRFLFRDGGRLAEAMFPPEHWAGAPGLAGYAHDPARAEALLAAAGFGPQQPLRLVYKTSSDPFRVRLATVIQAQLARVGIRVEVRSYDWGTFYGDIKAGRFQLYSLSWVGIRTPDIFRYVFHSASVPPQGANRGRYRSPRADRLIETARAEQDPERQAEHYRELQALLLEELPYIPLWYEHQVYAYRSEVQGYRLAPDGNYDGLAEVELGSGATERRKVHR
ncbi:ABC transporter substrate-binding protein [Candidatus Thiosymbion oneisti]|uniref:ABC transporter substrate-binding protein n=1 Tax=Candidatus Thiosymbion oneisti TaxID=589554 RepID=UPI001FB17C2C|nr:ABC transporter substrate-binding protein [Candidatus Thiosymbion oneisti]